MVALAVAMDLHLNLASHPHHPKPVGTPTPPSAGSPGRNYYVSPDGNDGLDGSAPDRAWKTLDRADQVAFRSGDHLLLRGGARFPGSIRLGSDDADDAAHPVVVDSYGGGRATIAPVDDAGVVVYDTAGVEIRNVVVAGDAATYTRASGIRFYSDLPGGKKLDHVVVSGVDVAGFQYGVEIGGGNGATGFRDVTVSDARLHSNRDAGLFTYGPTFNDTAPMYAHENITVDKVEAYSNPGNPAEHVRVSGSGIVLGSVRGGVVSNSTAHDNGASCNSASGPVGIWAYDSDDITIEHNVAYHNRTGGTTDGGGFDLDENVTSSVLQYNLSYGNDGPGYMLFGNKLKHAGVTARFNISHDDAGRSPRYGAVSVLGKIEDAQVYQNTVVTHPNGSRKSPALLLSGQLRAVSIRNNIFMAMGTQVLAARSDFTPSQVLLQGNDLYSGGSYPWQADWGMANFSRLAAWRSATGQERDSAGATGRSVDPAFANPKAQDAVGLARAAGFTLSAGSPVIGAGVELAASGVDPGTVDYFGAALADPPSIGAAGPPR